jgi:uncharacterized protein (DUF58 family)
MLKRFKALSQSIEYRMAAPSYSGALLLGMSLFFFIAATNSMAGWLYVMSGLILAMLGIAIFLVRQALRGIHLDRPLIEPVQAGDALRIRILLQNDSPQPKALLQVIDRLPPGLGSVRTEVLANLPARNPFEISYDLLANHRGVYRWQYVQVRTGAPLGLVWASRQYQSPIQAIVHPRVLPLSHCPLIDQLGQDPSLQLLSNRTAQAATAGQTRSLRPYRWGDSTRLIHWRTSARTGELRVRELETLTSGQAIVIALDSARSWNPADFEQAVTVAATLYFYALRQQLAVQIWTASTGLVKGDRPVLDSLAATNPNEMCQSENLPDLPIVWLTSGGGVQNLPEGSRSLLWNATGGNVVVGEDAMEINPTESIELQLAKLGS